MEQAINTFVYGSTVIFILLYLMWTGNKDWLNFFIRAFLFGMSAFGIFLSLKLLGWI